MQSYNSQAQDGCPTWHRGKSIFVNISISTSFSSDYCFVHVTGNFETYTQLCCCDPGPMSSWAADAFHKPGHINQLTWLVVAAVVAAMVLMLVGVSSDALFQ